MFVPLMLPLKITLTLELPNFEDDVRFDVEHCVEAAADFLRSMLEESL